MTRCLSHLTHQPVSDVMCMKRQNIGFQGSHYPTTGTDLKVPLSVRLPISTNCFLSGIRRPAVKVNLPSISKLTTEIYSSSQEIPVFRADLSYVFQNTSHPFLVFILISSCSVTCPGYSCACAPRVRPRPVCARARCVTALTSFYSATN